MEISIIGGTMGSNNESSKSSGIISKMYNIFKDNVIYYSNGSPLDKLFMKVNGDLIIWMPNISNEEEKFYPVKPTGSVLICSKVMREGYTRFEAVSRIFKMHGNAVIEIHKEDPKKVRFCLVDALANEWVDTTDINELCNTILKFYDFTKSAKRVRTTFNEDFAKENLFELYDPDTIESLLDINKKMQKNVMEKCGNRFFGNISTRCQKLFPSAKINGDYMFVSPRNSNKESLTAAEMVLYDMNRNSYCPNIKPSVDSPVQAMLYKHYTNINFMIHGHATILMDEAVTTENYKLCGDTNEYYEVINVVEKSDTTEAIVNLKNHGFLLMADSLETLDRLVNEISRHEIKIK